MSKAPTLTGLAAFTRKPAPQAAASTAEAPPPTQVTEPAQGPKKSRGQGETVSMTVRLSRADWERLHQLAVSEGTSIQRLAVDGFSKVFAEKGLPGLSA
jgi:hypothetical protein